jgi:hypothetical protein
VRGEERRDKITQDETKKKTEESLIKWCAFKLRNKTKDNNTRQDNNRKTKQIDLKGN